MRARTLCPAAAAVEAVVAVAAPCSTHDPPGVLWELTLWLEHPSIIRYVNNQSIK